MRRKIKEMKAFNVRFSKDLWMFLKKMSFEQEVSMNDIVVFALEKVRKSYEKKLTLDDIMIS